MLNREAKWVALFALLLVPFVVWAAALTSDYVPKECAGEGAADHDACSNLYRFFAPPIDVFEFIGEREKFLVSVGTVLIFVATFALWRATRDLVRGAENTAERQLRAYVFVEGADEDRLPTVDALHGIRVPLKIWNRGQTPAYKIVNSIGVDVLPFPLREEPPRRFFSPASRLDLGPHANVDIFAISDRPWTNDQLKGALEGTMRIYIYGEVRYRDAFKREQHTKYRLMIPVLPDGSLPGIEACEDGNETT